MSVFSAPILGGYGFPGYGFSGYATKVDEPADPQAKAEPNEPAERDAWTTAALSGFPGFGRAPPGTPALYWQMRKYSACVLAYAITAGPIFAGTRTLEICKEDGTPAAKRPGGPLAGDGPTEGPEDKIKADMQRHFEPLWPAILNGLECLNFGMWLQEVLWDRKGGLTLPVRFKDWLPNEFTLAADPYGDFAGYRSVTDGRDFTKTVESDRTPQYALHHVHQPHLNRLWGMPRLEQCREDWYRAVKTGDEIDRAQQKASGISLMLLVDQEFAFRDDAGNRVSGKTAAQTFVNALSTGGTAMGPRYTFSRKTLEGKPELAEHAPILAQQFDWGSTAPAILAGIAALDARDTRIMRGYGRPEREAMQGKHGTNAESDTQGQLAVQDSEKVHAERVGQFNAQTWRTLLLTNFGEKYLDRLYWKPTPLADDSKLFLEKAVLAMVSTPGDPLPAMIDRKALLSKAEIPYDESYTPQPQLPTTPDEANGGGGGTNGQPVNGNGNPDRMRALGLSAGGPDDGDPFELALNCGTGAGGFKSGNVCSKGGRQFVVSRVDRKGMVHGRPVDEHDPSMPPVELGHVSEFTAPLSAAPLPEFAARVQAIGDNLPAGFGDNKVYLSHVYDAARAEDPSLTVEGFKAKLKAANREGLLRLSRADLPLNPAEEARSEIALDPAGNATVHYLLVKSRDRRPVTTHG